MESKKETAVSNDARERLAGVVPNVGANATDQEEKLKRTAKVKSRGRGRPTKEEKEAESALEFVSVLGPSLGMLNEFVSAKYPAFRHSDEELAAICMLGSKVLAKHIDSATMKYAEEIALVMYLGGSLAQKAVVHKRLEAKKEKEKVPEVQVSNG